LIIEERLNGQELSVLAVTDGRTIITLPRHSKVDR